MAFRCCWFWCAGLKLIGETVRLPHIDVFFTVSQLKVSLRELGSDWQQQQITIVASVIVTTTQRTHNYKDDDFGSGESVYPKENEETHEKYDYDETEPFISDDTIIVSCRLVDVVCCYRRRRCRRCYTVHALDEFKV